MVETDPISILPQIAKIVGNEALFEFALYTYQKGKQEDSRRILAAHAHDAYRYYCDVLYPQALKAKREVALQSRVIFPDQTCRHILMADLLPSGMHTEARVRLEKLFTNCGAQEVRYFESGNSYHAYGIAVVSSLNFYDICGQMLLLRDNAGRRIVDDRWLGHRIRAGYWALRLTRNDKQHAPSYAVPGNLGNAKLTNRAVLRESDPVILTCNLPDAGLMAGDVGTIILVHDSSAGYEVEFTTLNGQSVATLTLMRNQVRPTTLEEVWHSRLRATGQTTVPREKR